MKQASTLRIVRHFRASRSIVFRAWTDPDELKKWWNLGEGWRLSVAQVDLRVGGQFRIGLESVEGYMKHSVTGVYKQVQPPEKLVYTWVVDDPKLQGQESLVTVEFLAGADNSTEVVLIHERLDNETLRENNLAGWTLVLDGLAQMLSSRKA